MKQVLVATLLNKLLENGIKRKTNTCFKITQSPINPHSTDHTRNREATWVLKFRGKGNSKLAAYNFETELEFQ